jgi:GNAT superfamily N-acetyltransferase
MRAALHIRRATPDDAEPIARLVTQLGYPATASDIPARLTRLAGHDRGAVLIAERGDAPVGLATVHLHTVINRPRDVAWLTALVVEESARGTGVGRALVAAVEQFAREAGCERLSVTTHERRADARAFYTRLGLEQTGRRFGKALTP